MILKYIGRGAFLLIGLIILALSLLRVGLSNAQEKIDEVRKNEVNIVITDNLGNKESKSYKLPEVGMLPDSMFYGFKKIRDYIWLASSNGIEKPKLALLMADKKVAEYQELIKDDKNKLAIEAGIEATDKLKYAEDLISSIKPQNDRTKELHQKILWAGLAYKEIFKLGAEGFDIDQEAYSQLISRIDVWNKDQETNRFNWDI